MRDRPPIVVELRHQTFDGRAFLVDTHGLDRVAPTGDGDVVFSQGVTPAPEPAAISIETRAHRYR